MKEEQRSLLRLDRQLCFALYACSKEIIRRYKPLLQPHGMTYTQYIAMLALWERDDISVTELGERLLLDSGTLTPLLKKMEKAGILTDRGKRLKDEFAAVPEEMLCATGLTAEQADRLKTELCGLTMRLRKDEGEGGEGAAFGFSEAPAEKKKNGTARLRASALRAPPRFAVFFVRITGLILFFSQGK